MELTSFVETERAREYRDREIEIRRQRERERVIEQVSFPGLTIKGLTIKLSGRVCILY